MQLSDEQINEIQKISSSHYVKYIYLFGSAMRDDFNETSDYDFLVRFNDVELLDYLDNYNSLKDRIENYLGRSIDLIEEQAVKNPYMLRNIRSNKKLVYG